MNKDHEGVYLYCLCPLCKHVMTCFKLMYFPILYSFMTSLARMERSFLTCICLKDVVGSPCLVYYVSAAFPNLKCFFFS